MRHSRTQCCHGAQSAQCCHGQIVEHICRQGMVLDLVSACTSMLSSVKFCPLPATRRRKPDWLGGVAPALPAAGDGAVI